MHAPIAHFSFVSNLAPAQIEERHQVGNSNHVPTAVVINRSNNACRAIGVAIVEDDGAERDGTFSIYNDIIAEGFFGAIRKSIHVTYSSRRNATSLQLLLLKFVA